jgi:hypothetical protein
MLYTIDERSLARFGEIVEGRSWLIEQEEDFEG